MNIQAGDYQYEWIDNWARVVDNESGRTNGRTHGVQETSSGEIVVFCQASPSVLFFDSNGVLLRSWGDYPGAHGLTLVTEDGIDYLWLTDQDSRLVVKTTLNGEVVQSLDRPDHAVYVDGAGYVPTWVAVNEERFGGNGDIWVADGYGSSLLHRYDKSGAYVATLDGSEGAGKFRCPHGIAIVKRKGGYQLLIADRANHRIQAYNTDGTFIETFGEDFLVHPDCFSEYNGVLLVPELFGRVALLDENNDLVGYLGRNDEAPQIPGWPNLTPTQLQSGKFSSPHGGAFDHDGNIYIVEWIVGGRITKLKRL